MFIYWAMVLFPALLSLAHPARRTVLAQIAMSVLFVALFLILSLRETGGDYPMYLKLYELLVGASLGEAMEVVEPGYGLLNWLSSQLDLGIYGVNGACALIVLYCLFSAAARERDPLLLLTLAIPYFVIVIAMGYTRQGVAVSLVWLGMIQMREARLGRAAIAIALGATFHFSAFAAMAFPIIAVTREQKGVAWFASRALLAAVLAFAARYLFDDTLEGYASNYLESDRYESGGAFLRACVTGLAAAVFFLKTRRFKAVYDDYGIWLPFAVLALAFVPLSIYASTPADRAGLYLFPFQLVGFARMPSLLWDGRYYTVMRAAIVVSYLGYFFVWLHLGTYSAELWVPYKWLFS
ncbi:EpsG family protein [Ramlibacter montanisoli]|uniref:EpsG family protein n=1 Tax=Ramlibacter montanisoli TaxID=2732512 RepID=A0A849KB54_9BURK|nr:EpsG family protein [Ramlibacter montanisoli]NNU43674.1 EpsG family protein [Ramlibacter montanisoli]